MWIYRDRSGQASTQTWCRQRLDDWHTPHRTQLVHGSLGTTTHLVVVGEGHEHTVVYVPGRHSNAAISTPLLDVLAQQYRVIAVDLPGEAGLGSGGRPNTDRLREYGTWLDETLAAVGDDAVTVLGHGFGAAVALAATPSTQVRGLVLLDPAGLMWPSYDPAVTAATVAWRLWPSAQSSARLLRTLSSPERAVSPALMDWLQVVGRHVACSSTPPADLGLAERWRSTPCSVAAGEHDLLFPPERLTGAARRTLDAPVLVVPDAGYLLPYEQPHAVLGLLEHQRHSADSHRGTQRNSRQSGRRPDALASGASCPILRTQQDSTTPRRFGVSMPRTSARSLP